MIRNSPTHSTQTITGLALHRLALAAALVPVVAIHLSAWLSFALDLLPACMPYWRDCHSISATGRQVPAMHVFKGLMLPMAALTAGYWYLLFVWMQRQLGASRSALWLLALGLIAAVAMAVYVVTLGQGDGAYAVLRRTGAALYFAFSAFAHLLLHARLWGARCQRDWPKLMRAFAAVNIFLLMLGLANSLVGFFWADHERWENAIEWWFALLLMAQFFIVSRLWRCSEFKLRFSLNIS